MAKATTPKNLDPTDRDIASERDLEDAFRMMLEAPAETRPKAKNKEPTAPDLNRRYRLVRQS